MPSSICMMAVFVVSCALLIVVVLLTNMRIEERRHFYVCDTYQKKSTGTAYVVWAFVLELQSKTYVAHHRRRRWQRNEQRKASSRSAIKPRPASRPCDALVEKGTGQNRRPPSRSHELYDNYTPGSHYKNRRRFDEFM